MTNFVRQLDATTIVAEVTSWEHQRSSVSVIFGDNLYLDADGNVVSVSNAATNLRVFYEACEGAGVPRPTGVAA